MGLTKELGFWGGGEGVILRSDSLRARWMEEVENVATRDEAPNVVGRAVVKGRIVWRR